MASTRQVADLWRRNIITGGSEPGYTSGPHSRERSAHVEQHAVWKWALPFRNRSRDFDCWKAIHIHHRGFIRRWHFLAVIESLVRVDDIW